jgi:hypothetical protein
LWEMKIIKMAGQLLWMCCLLFSCRENDEDVFDFRPCDCGNQTLNEISGYRGEIGFHDEMQKFVIYRHIPNSIDSRQLFFLCQTPEEFQQEGLKVRFSGEAKEPCRTPTNLTGAQQFYDFRITLLERE